MPILPDNSFLSHEIEHRSDRVGRYRPLRGLGFFYANCSWGSAALHPRLYAGARAAGWVTQLYLPLQRNCLLGPKLKLTMLVFFSQSQDFATGDPADMFKDTRADFLNRLGAVDYATR